MFTYNEWDGKRNPLWKLIGEKIYRREVPLFSGSPERCIIKGGQFGSGLSPQADSREGR